MLAVKSYSSRPAGTATKRYLFRGIALLIPFLLLFLLEVALRLFNYGYDTRLFIESPGDRNYLVMNPDASKKYFTDQLNATTGNREFFRKRKAPNTLRFFILGESTTIGYPYFHNGSFHRWLLYRLMRTFPGKEFELVNVSLTAVNSYTVAGFARQVVDYEPDAVLIYSGHNEYYGALGVGSTNQLGSAVWLVNDLLWLRDLRFIQLLTRIAQTVTRWFTNHGPYAGKTRMELMVRDQQIPYGSPAFGRGLAQFSRNMDAALSLFHRHHIPVFISTVVSNEKDQQPFISIPGDSSVNALSDYYLGNQAYSSGDFSTARTRYNRAKELDALRFRAPDQINYLIRALCRKYENVHLVDAEAAFMAASPHGIIGHELLLEHVHPNLSGYALLADVFYNALRMQGLLPAADGHEMSFEQLREEMPITKMDSLTGLYKICHLKGSWPFKDTAYVPAGDSASVEGRLASAVAFDHEPWEDAIRRLYDAYSAAGDWPDAATVMETLVLEHPTDSALYDRAAMLCGKVHEDDKAVFYLRKSFSIRPSFEKAHYLFVLLFQLDRPAEAMPYLDYAITNNSSGWNLSPVRNAALQILQLEQVLVKDSTDIPALRQIARTYAMIGCQPAAQLYQSRASARSAERQGFDHQETIVHE